MSTDNVGTVETVAGASPAVETPAVAKVRKTRESRSNHGAAESNPITDVASAQSYVTAVRAATVGEVNQRMWNKSGPTTPAVLDLEDPENLLRLTVCIVDALARQTSDAAVGVRATASLAIVGNYLAGVADLQRKAAIDAAASLIQSVGGHVSLAQSVA